MSVLVECSMGELNGDRKPLFPLFEKGPKPQNVPFEKDDESFTEKFQDKPFQNDISGKDTTPNNKRSKNVGESDNVSSTLSNETQVQAHLDMDPNESRKKRRKTSIDGKAKSNQAHQIVVDGRDGRSNQLGEVNLEGITPVRPISALEALSDKSSKKKQSKSKIPQQLNPVPHVFKISLQNNNTSQALTNQQTGILPMEIPLDGSVDSTSPNPKVPHEKLPASNTTTSSKLGPTSSVNAETRPKKVLQFNPKTGTIGSPPKPKLPLQDTRSLGSSIDLAEESLRPIGAHKISKKLRSLAPKNGTFEHNFSARMLQELLTSDSGIHTNSSRSSTVTSAVICSEESDRNVLNFHPKIGSINPDSCTEASPRDSLNSGIDTENLLVSKAVSAAVPSGSSGTKPQKVLYFNTTTGTIGSPPKKQSNTMAGTTVKKVKRGKQTKSLIVTIRYEKSNVFPIQGETVHPDLHSQDEIVLSKAKAVFSQAETVFGETETVFQNDKTVSLSIGQRIGRILNAEERFVPVTGPSQVARGDTIKTVKSIYRPLLSKITISQSTQNISGKTIDLIELAEPEVRGSLRKSRGGTPEKDSLTNSFSSRVEHPSPTRKKLFENLGESAKLLKFPGAMEPAWPCKGMVHINPDLTAFHSQMVDKVDLPDLKSINEKWKTHAVGIVGDEDIMKFIAGNLGIISIASSIREINLDTFPSVPSCLRIPQKIHTTGPGIQSRVRNQLRYPIPSPNQDDHGSSEDETSLADSHPPAPIHPSLAKTYTSIPTNLSAFDRGQCETQAWPQKYAPEKADQVLQIGPEVLELKSWLVSQTINSVESTGSSLKHTAPKKRKRKPVKQEDFIVYSDEEGDDEVKIKNTILISGPHGCGKTAAIYAVAKELDFEVFEINSGCRRSGRDIFAKVGDMIGNHLVQGVKEMPQLDGMAEERRAEFENDLKTGRQGTLNSFFSAKPSKAKSTVRKPTETAANGPKAPNQTVSVEQKKQATLGNTNQTRASAKEQKQSLILIEEADIIYKQDSQFWSTIEKLQDISRRPIILTCNDENAIPLPRDTLHTTLMFKPPPVDLAVDHMLLIAASEGHLIQREAVKTLYEGRNMDLRASLMELNFWCQFAVGDESRGLGWYYPRTRGREDMENGHKIRVVSEGTYQTGMGWLPRDTIKSHDYHFDVNDESLHEACESLGLDLGDWEESIKIDAWADDIQNAWSTKDDQLSTLNVFSSFTDHMSDADILSNGLFGSLKQASLDTTQPDLWDFEQYPIAYHVTNAPEYRNLHAPDLVAHSPLTKDISLFCRSRGRNLLQMDSNPAHCNENQQDLYNISESHILKLVCNQVTNPTSWLSQEDLSDAFQPFRLFEPTNQKTDNQQFKRTQRILTEDLAPYVRGIVAYDGRLKKERDKLNSLLTEGGRPGKRQRTTRSAFSAIAGGPREHIRRDRWFSDLPDFNSILVLRTAGNGWTEAAVEFEIKQMVQMENVTTEESEKEE